MDVFTIDYETYYDKEYSLSKLSVENYLNNVQFEVIGLAVKKNDEPTEWFSGPHDEIKAWLDEFDFSNAAIVMHNAVFDYAILNWVFGVRPKLVIDTLSMARAVHGTEVGGSLKALAIHYDIGAKGTEVLNALGKRRVDFSEEELEAYAGYCINDVDLTYKLFTLLAPRFKDRKSTRLNSSHSQQSRMPSSA